MNLLFHQAALGDFVLTFPLLRAMTEPTTVVAPWSKAALAARLFPHVTPMDIELWEFTRLHGAGGPTSVSPAIRDLFSQARRIISFISGPKDAWAENVARLGPQAQLVHVMPRPPADWSRPIGDWHRQQLAQQGMTVPAPSAANARSAPPGTSKNRPVVVHPGSGGRDKCWPPERFETLMQRLRDDGRPVVPVLGEAEIDRWSNETVQRWQIQHDARVLQTLDDLANVLSSASCYLGNDSGPTHLAAQMGLRTVALFGPTDPRVWAPVGPDVTVLAPPAPTPMDWLDVKPVLAACRQQR